jgi:MFS family permease
VTAFYAYPTLVRGALSFFACLPIDDANQQPYPEYAIRNNTAGYWVGAIQQECFAGWHRSWALGFGLPAMLVLCVGVPCGMFMFLWCSKAKLSDASFQEHYGFLFRNYKDSKPWWEAIWTAQTVLLTAISVFHFTLQAYYALMLMALVLFVSVCVQIGARPYEQRLLHRLHLASTCCLFLLAWMSLALFSASVVVTDLGLSRAHTAIGVAMVALACSFVLWCLVFIGRVASPVLRDYASRAAAWLQHCIGGAVGCCHHPKVHNSSGRPSGSV